MRLDPVSLDDIEVRAKKALPHDVADFVEAGSFNEITMRRNREALNAISLRPGLLRDVSKRDLSTTVLGQRVSFPIMIGPANGQGFIDPEAEVAIARAAGKAGVLMALSTGSHRSLEEVAQAAAGPLWFQLYHMSRKLSAMLVRRAEKAGYKAVCVTVDTPVPNSLERDDINEFHHHGGAVQGTFMDAESRKLMGPKYDPSDFFGGRPPTANVTTDDLDWLRSITSLPLVIKGIRSVGDAMLCLEHGTVGIVVSNHGARQVDSTLSSVETLRDIAKAVDGKMEVYFDSGIRRGSDLVKVLALGARAALVGRPQFWGLALGGEEGVSQMLELLRKEFDLCLGYCGFTSVQEINSSVVAMPKANGSIYRDTPDELNALSSLLKDGIITPKEYEAKKKAISNRRKRL
ncbi:MAG: alpha-hydroxy-acid oxidizing protein [SAR202 cluster bacterium]|nr:alpha-hydroxy-acid oxidizing protein [SAR202 cluster bacterium]